jgi:hypothetical protein
VGGTAWRAAVATLATPVAIALGAGVAAPVAGYDDRLASGPAFAAALVPALLSVGWLRARTAYVVLPLLAGMFAAMAGAEAAHSALGAGLRPSAWHWAGWEAVSRFDRVTVGVAGALAVLSVLVAAVAGHVAPRVTGADPADSASPAAGAGSAGAGPAAGAGSAPSAGSMPGAGPVGAESAPGASGGTG